jgi:hypothetical protein
MTSGGDFVDGVLKFTLLWQGSNLETLPITLPGPPVFSIRGFLSNLDLHSEAGRLAIAKAENEEQLNKSINPNTILIFLKPVLSNVIHRSTCIFPASHYFHDCSDYWTGKVNPDASTIVYTPYREDVKKGSI